MTSPHPQLLRIAAATVFLALSATAVQAAHSPSKGKCVAAVEQSLKSQGVSAEAIANTKYVTDIANLEIGSIREYQAPFTHT